MLILVYGIDRSGVETSARPSFFFFTLDSRQNQKGTYTYKSLAVQEKKIYHHPHRLGEFVQ